MVIENYELYLKNGKKCCFRSPRIEDAGDIVNHLVITSSETNYMSRFSDEIDKDIENTKKSIENDNNDSGSIIVCAEIDGKIIGQGGISLVRNNRKFMHRAKLGLSIQKGYWNLSIGTIMMDIMLKKAKEMSIEQLELTVSVDNIYAISLYNKFGFEIVGTISKSLKISKDYYIDEYYMICHLFS